MRAGELDVTLAGLPGLERAALMEHWTRLYGTPPPANYSRPLLIMAIAYRMQEQAFGGLKPATQRFLGKVVQDNASGKPLSPPVASIKPGTRLLREWHGVAHEVTILEEGVQYQNRQYRSLSEVAREITGVRWSGPLFFGLKKGGI